MRTTLTALAFALLVQAMPANAGTIFVDTGHSRGQWGSKASDGTPEYVINRNMSVQVIEALRLRGHEVVDVGASSRDISLRNRVKDTAGADLFLSIHHDSIQPQLMKAGRAPEFAGFSVFISGKSQKLKGSLRCAVHVGDAMVAAGERPSKYHAAPIRGEQKQLLDDRRGIHRYDDLVVLKHAQSPAILLEVGVIVNPLEISKLTDPNWIARTAAMIAEGVERCIPPPTSRLID